MKTIFFEKSPKLINIPIPDKKKNESLIKVIYAGICKTDIEIMKGYMDFKGVMGHEFVGKIERGIYKGKRVVGEINIGCGVCSYCKIGLSRHCKNREVMGIYKKNILNVVQF